MTQQQYVTLVARGGTPVQLSNQQGAPYPTTGHGALVFANNPTLYSPIIEGGWVVLEAGRAIARTNFGTVLVSDPLTSNLIRIKDARDDGNGQVLIETYGPHNLSLGQTVSCRIDGFNGTTLRAHPGNGDLLPIASITTDTFVLSSSTWVVGSEFWTGFLWESATTIVDARTALTTLLTQVEALGGGNVQLPAGVCVLRKLAPASGPGLLLREGVSLIGAGNEVTTLFAYDNLNGHTVQSAGAGNLTVAGLTIYGNRQRQGVGGFHGIRFGADNVLTENVTLDIWIQAAAGYGAALQSTNSSFRGFRFTLRINGCDSDGIDCKNRADGNDANDITAQVENFGLFRVGVDTPGYTLPQNPFTTTLGSGSVTVQHTSNNFSVGIPVTFPNGGVVNGINLTGTFLITAKSGKNAYVIATGQTASASGAGGGTGVIEYNAQFSQGDAGIDCRGAGFNVAGRVYSDLRGRTGIRLRPGAILGTNPGAIYTNLLSAHVTNTGTRSNANGITVGRDANNLANMVVRNTSFGLRTFSSASGNNISNLQAEGCAIGALMTGDSNALSNAYLDTCGTGLSVVGGSVEDAEFFPEDPFTVTAGSPIVTAYAPGHGQTTGALVEIADASVAFGIDFNVTSAAITVLDSNTFRYNPGSGNATGNGTGGGENAYYSFGVVATGAHLQMSNIRTNGCELGIRISAGAESPQIIGHTSRGDSVALLDQGTSSYLLPPASYDPVVVAWALAVFDAGGVVTDAELEAIDAFVAAERTAGTFDLVDDYFLLGVGNAIASLTSLKQRRLGRAVNNPTFTPYLGYTGDGVSSYINTQWAPSSRCVAATANNIRVSAFVLTDAPGATSVLGAASGGATIRLRPSNGAAAAAQVCAAFAGFPDVVATTVGYTAAQRAGAALMSGQRDNTALTDVAVASPSSSLPSDVMVLLARNNGGVISEFFAGQVFAAVIGGPMNLTQGQAQNANLVALQAALAP